MSATPFHLRPHKPYSIASVADSKENVVIIGSMSKTFAMTGWRIGYTLAPEGAGASHGQAAKPVHLQSHLNRATRSGWKQCAAPWIPFPSCSPNTPAAVAASFDGLRAIPGVTCEDPGGAFYAFPNVSAHLANGTAGNALAKTPPNSPNFSSKGAGSSSARRCLWRSRLFAIVVRHFHRAD